jgi:predicted flap endonuclease-1-like 5' DNA nuclease
MTSLIILILLILAAFLLGWLLSRLIFSGGNSNTEADNLASLVAERQVELEACRNKAASLNASFLAKSTPSPSVTTEYITPVAPVVNTIESPLPVDDLRVDDLKIVEGIGPKIEELLHNAGIKTYFQLASANVEQLSAILEAAGPRYQMHNPSTWAQQANLAYTGQWNELKILQDQLNKGVA